MGPGDIEDGGLVVVQQKTGKELWVPLHPDLRGALEGWESSPYVVNRREPEGGGLHLRPLQIGLGRLHGRDACRQDQGRGLRLPRAARVELREAP